MDQLDQHIADKEAEVAHIAKEIDALSRRQERLAIEVETLKKAAELRPGSAHHQSIAPAPPPPRATTSLPPGQERNPVYQPKVPFGGKTGRQPGDISHPWRKTLRRIKLLHRRVTYDEIQKCAAEEGIETQLPNVRERVRNMVENGLMSGTSEIGFLVTAKAVHRFKFEGMSLDAFNENEAPNA